MIDISVVENTYEREKRVREAGKATKQASRKPLTR